MSWLLPDSMADWWLQIQSKRHISLDSTWNPAAPAYVYHLTTDQEMAKRIESTERWVLDSLDHSVVIHSEPKSTSLPVGALHPSELVVVGRKMGRGATEWWEVQREWPEFCRGWIEGSSSGAAAVLVRSNHAATMSTSLAGRPAGHL